MDKAIDYRRRGAKGTLSLNGPVGIIEALTLREAALEALGDEKTATVSLDLRKAKSLDVSAIQILSALQREIQASGRVFSIEAVPASIATLWEQIGFAL